MRIESGPAYAGKHACDLASRLLVHGFPRLVRYQLLGGDKDWSPPLERSGHEPLTLVDFNAGTWREIWPSPEHHGRPVLLPSGEEGCLLRLERPDIGTAWTWALEFHGKRKPD